MDPKVKAAALKVLNELKEMTREEFFKLIDELETQSGCSQCKCLTCECPAPQEKAEGEGG